MAAVRFDSYLFVGPARVGGGKIMVEINQQGLVKRVAKTGDLFHAPLATNRFTRMTHGGQTYALKHNGLDSVPMFYGEYRRHRDYGISFINFGPDQRAEKTDSRIGYYVRAVEVEWAALSPEGHEAIEQVFNARDRSTANALEFMEPLKTVASRPTSTVFADGPLRVDNGEPFVDFENGIEKLCGPFTVGNFISNAWGDQAASPKALADDLTLSPSIHQAIDYYFRDELSRPGAILLDPMLGTGSYLKEWMKVVGRWPCRVIVSDLDTQVVEVFPFDDVEKLCGDAEKIMRQLKSERENIRLVVLRGCNFMVVPPEKAKAIFRHIYFNLPVGAGIIAAGVTSVLLDSTFIGTLPGAEIRQRIAWNTYDVPVPFYVVIKEK